ncbi:MAG: hypothetical protein JGK27_03190 [Microcoleus sp. PH2017_20_SFW_D_A]|nr:hypothetical protein [Microcoleus sp. PH2017_20_SFW_D_A]
MDTKLARLYLLRIAPFFTISIPKYLGYRNFSFFDPNGEPENRGKSTILIIVGWASRPSRKDGRDAHPTNMCKLFNFYSQV